MQTMLRQILSRVRQPLALGALLLPLVAAGPVAAQCTGDCGGDNEVTVDEIIIMVNIANGAAAVDTCTAADLNGDGSVTIDEIITAVGNALNGCAPVTPTPTPTPSVTPEPCNPTPTPTPPARCGNGQVEFNLGEVCDDGNTEEGDNTCPYNCRRGACQTTGVAIGTRSFDVIITPPAGIALQSYVVFIRYPDEAIRIPGLASENLVFERFSDLPPDAFVTVNDLNYGTRVVTTSFDGSPLPGLVATVEFDVCSPEVPFTACDIRCTVEDASESGTSEEVEGATCALAAR